MGLGTELMLSTSMQLYQLVLAHPLIQPNIKPNITQVINNLNCNFKAFFTFLFYKNQNYVSMQRYLIINVGPNKYTI